MDVVGPTRFQARQHTDQAVGDAVARHDRAGDGFFASGGGGHILERPTLGARQRFRVLLHPIRDALRKPAKVLQQDPSGGQERLEPRRVTERAQVPRKIMRSNPDKIPAMRPRAVSQNAPSCCSG